MENTKTIIAALKEEIEILKSEKEDLEDEKKILESTDEHGVVENQSLEVYNKELLKTVEEVSTEI